MPFYNSRNGCACLAVMLLLLAGTVSAAEQITNGNFETGDLTGWTVGGSAGVDTVEKHSGIYSVKIPDYYYYYNISQDVDLTGVTNISYWTYHYGTGMTVKIDATVIYTEASAATS